MRSFEHQARDKSSIPPKKGRGKGRDNAKGKGPYSPRNDGSGWAGLAGADTMITIHTAVAVKAKGNGTAGHARMHGREVANAYASPMSRGAGQFPDRLMWEGSSSHARTEKEELSGLVADKARSDLGIEGECSSR